MDPISRRPSLRAAAAALFLFVFAGASAFAQPVPRGDVMIDESFQLAAGRALHVDVSDADVIVSTHADRSARVRIYLYGRDMARARDYFERQRFEVAQDGGDVTVATDPQRGVSIVWGDRSGGANITVVAEIPVASDIRLETSDGDVWLDDVEGTVRLRTADGDVTFNSIRGPSISVVSADGDLSGSEVVGESVEIKTSDGDIRADVIEASTVDLNTADGDVILGTVAGELALRTVDGDISVENADGRRISMRTSDGEIRITSLRAAESTLQSSDGSIFVRNAEGGLDVSTTDGDIEVGLVKPGAVSLRATDGDIVVSVDGGLPASVELWGTQVRVASSLEFSGRIERRSAEGTINGGGELIRARAADGTVRVSGN